MILAHADHDVATFDAAWAAGTFVLRLGEALLAALPELLVGVVVAGLMRHFLGDGRLRQWLGRWWSAAAVCVALPIGAAGALPMAVMAWRAGVRPAGVAAVLLLGGAVGPLSLAYLPDRIGIPVTAAAVAMVAAGVAALFLVVRSRTEGGSVGDDDAGLLPALGEARPLIGRSVVPLVIGLIGFATTAGVLPPSYVGGAVIDWSPGHVVGGAAVPLVSFYTPSNAALFAGEASTGVYRGAAWAMLLGGGVTLGTAWLLIRLVGWRSALIGGGTFLAVVALGIVAWQVGPRAVAFSPEDSHGFDGLSQPYHVLDHPDGTLAGLTNQWAKIAGPGTLASAIGLAVLLLLPRRESVGRQHLSTGTLRWLIPAGVAAWLVGAAYIYYPSAPATLDRIRSLEGDLASATATRDQVAATRAIHDIHTLAARGSIGARLRLNPPAADAFAEVRQVAASVEPAAEHWQLDDVRPLLTASRAVPRE
jgi:hypothetical protein